MLLCLQLTINVVSSINIVKINVFCVFYFYEKFLLVTMLVKEDIFKVVEYVTLRVITNAKVVQV